MRKFCAGMFVVCYVVYSAIVYGATVEVSGKKLECPRKAAGVFSCTDNGSEFLVVDEGRGFVAISRNADKHPTVELVDKVMDGERVLFEVSPLRKKTKLDSKNERLKAASSVVYALKNVKLPLAEALVQDSKDFIKDTVKNDKKLTINVGDDDKAYQCLRGETAADAATNAINGMLLQCDYYSCAQDGSDKKILAYMPIGDSYEGPSIMSMKDGQAQYVNHNFKATSSDGSLYLNVDKKEEDDGPRAIIDTRLPLPDVDPDLFIPSKYNESKTSFARMQELAAGDFEQESTDLCSSDNIKSLFAEQKKIASQMKDHLAEADLIEYLKMIDGNITSFYVDKTKGLELGCSYQGKVIDSSVLGNFQHLLDISTTKTPKKYLSVGEVQGLFNKAKNMKDIPFGYKYDGCYARAHIMARRFEKMGYAPQKVWIKGDLYVPGTDIRWNYHVAPVLEVKEANGKIVKYVIDPSLTDKAVPVDQWVAAMGKNTTGPIMKTTYPFPANSIDFQRTTVAISSVDPLAPVDIMAATEEEKMEMATSVLKDYTEVLKSAGK